MSSSSLSAALRRFRSTLGFREPEPSADARLLERYAGTRDEDVFAALVRRHGLRVWAVCRRVLADEHAAEDAFQATFLVLTRKAGSIRRGDSLAGWLHRVAFRLALAARPGPSAPQPLLDDVPARAATAPHAEAAAREIRAALDEEVNRLPEKYRLPVILCFLNGSTHAEAAAELGWPLGTVAGRLARAKKMLQGRLARRGLAPSITALASLPASAPAMPPNLASGAVGAMAAASPRACALAEGLLAALGRRTWLVAAVLFLTPLGALALLALPGDRLPAPQAGEPQPHAKPASLAAHIPRNRMTHEGAVWAVAVHPDGRTVASAGTDRVIKLWDGATGTLLATLRGHKDTVRAVAFSPDGKTLASASFDYAVRLWDVATHKLRGTLKGHVREVNALAFSPDGAWIATGGDDRTVRIWDASTGKVRTVLRGPGNSVSSLAYSPDGLTLATGCYAGEILLWDTVTGQPAATPREPGGGGVRALAFSPDGKTLAIGGADGDRNSWIHLWDVAAKKTRVVLTGSKKCQGGEMTALAYSPDGKTLVTASYHVEGKIYVRDARTAETVSTLRAHYEYVLCLAFARDGKTLVSGGHDKTVRLWDPATGKLQGGLQGHTCVSAVAFSPDGKTLAANSFEFWGTSVRLWDTATWKVRTTLRRAVGGGGYFAFSPDGKTLASDGSDGTIKLWGASTGKELATLHGHKDWAGPLAYSPDGKTLASAGADRTITLWDVAARAEVAALKHNCNVSTLAFDRAGATLAWADEGGTIRLWDVATRKVRLSLPAKNYWVTSLAFSPDGTTLAAGLAMNPPWHSGHRVRLWDPATGKLRGAWLEGKDPVFTVAYSPDGRVLACSDQGGLRLHDARTGKELAVLKGHTQPVRSVAFSPDGRTLASASKQDEILLWDVSPRP